MEESSTYWDEIDTYLSKEMTEEDARQFEARLDTDAQLVKDVQKQIRAKAMAFESGRASWRAQKLKKLKENPSPSRTLWQSPSTWAAVAAVLIGIAVVIWRVSIPSTASQAENQAWIVQNYELPKATTVRSELVDSVLNLAFTAYNQQQYERALEGFYTQYPSASPASQSKIAFFLGMSYLELQQYSESRDILGKVKGAEYQQMVKWYTAYSYFFEKDIQSAQKAFQEIASKEGFYQRQAVEILQRIKTME